MSHHVAQKSAVVKAHLRPMRREVLACGCSDSVENESCTLVPRWPFVDFAIFSVELASSCEGFAGPSLAT